MADTGLRMTLPGMIACWDFQEAAGQERVAKGPHPYRLREGAGAIARVEDGVLGTYAARLERGQWLHIPRSECRALDLHGPKARVTVAAWVKRDGPPSNQCEAVAGIWNETRRKRQYCLFLNLRIWDSAEQVCGHVSGVGGPTPGHRWCMDAAIGATEVPRGVWECVAFTYDAQEARAYRNGLLDRRAGRNPYPYAEGLFDGGRDGADFTVGAVDRGGEMGNFYTGLLGGLAVYDRALSDDELRRLAAQTSP